MILETHQRRFQKRGEEEEDVDLLLEGAVAMDRPQSETSKSFRESLFPQQTDVESTNNIGLHIPNY